VFTCEYLAFPAKDRKTFVAEVNGRLIASVQLFGVPIRDEAKRPVTIGGIANVCTLPEYRGQGIARRLMAKATVEMKSLGYPWALLLTERNSFYEQIGWRTIHRSFLQVQTDSFTGSDLVSDVVKEADPDLRRLRALSEPSFETPLSRYRTDLDWDIRIPVRIESKSVFMSDSAFVIVRTLGTQGVIEEWGMKTLTVEGFHCLLISVQAWAKSNGIKSLVISAPILAEARQALETLFLDVRNVEEIEAMVLPLAKGWQMARLISFFALPNARFFRIDNF